MTREEKSSHFVEVHGFQRLNEVMSFKREYCIVCGKPALYKVGVKHYCKTHEIEARQQREFYVSNCLELKQKAHEQEVNRIERVLKSREQLHLNQKQHYRGHK